MADKEGSGGAVEHENTEFLVEENVVFDNSPCKIKLFNDHIEFQEVANNDNLLESILWDDLLKISSPLDPGSEGSFTIHHIKNLGHVPPDEKGIRWTCIQRTIVAEAGREHFVTKLRDNMEEMFNQKVNRRPRSLLILVNPKSGNAKGNEIYEKKVKPLMDLVDMKVDKVVMEGTEQTRKLLNEYDLSTIDGIVAMGGDGSMADLINNMVLRHLREAEIEPDNAGVEVKPIPITLGVIPAGTGQGDTLILNGSFDTETAVLHIIKGAVTKGDLYSCHSGSKWLYSGMLSGGVGYLADLLVYAETKRWLGTWRYLFSFFRTIWYLNTFDAEIEILKLNEDGTEEREKIEGKFLEIDVSPGRVGIGTFFPGALEVMVQKEAPKGDIMKFVGKLKKADKSLYDSPHLLAQTVKEVKITFPNIKKSEGSGDAESKVDISAPGSVLHIDGELFPITDPQVTFRLHRHVMNYFGILRHADLIVHG